MTSISYKKIKIELHDGSKDLTSFSCGHEDLNEFLKKKTQ